MYKMFLEIGLRNYARHNFLDTTVALAKSGVSREAKNAPPSKKAGLLNFKIPNFFVHSDFLMAFILSRVGVKFFPLVLPDRHIFNEGGNEVEGFVR